MSYTNNFILGNINKSEAVLRYKINKISIIDKCKAILDYSK